MSRTEAIPIDQSRAWAARRAGAGSVGAADATQHLALNAEDGTLSLLRSGFVVAGIAVMALIATLWVFGGVGVAGPRTVAGWLCLIVALMSMPFGWLLLLLGGAKWLRNHYLSRRDSCSDSLS